MPLEMEPNYIKNVDQIRQVEYPQLKNTTYLDHAGTTLYSQSLISTFAKDLSSHLYGNPHSASPSSALSTARVDRVRARVLRFFKADPEHFDVVFVANATAAIKLVMQGFQDYSSTQDQAGSKEEQYSAPSHPGFYYAYHYDAHTSLVGLREAALLGSLCFSSDAQVEDWLSSPSNSHASDPANNDFFSSPLRSAPGTLGLFAYPAQSNPNGHRPSLSWPARLRSSTAPHHANVYTLLDAAAYVTTTQLDLSTSSTAPDFVALSFYKIFGFPNLGALLVRKAAAHILTRRRRYFGGGTVDMVITLGEPWVARKFQNVHTALEDGTLPFHAIIALDAALDSHAALFGNMSAVAGHTQYLARVLWAGLDALRYAGGARVCEIYKHPESVYGNGKTQGPTVAFNVRKSSGSNGGEWVEKSEVERLAIRQGIQLRTGGVCNPGGIERYLDLTPAELRSNYDQGTRCGNNLDVLQGRPTGVVRVSLGAMSSMKDVDTFVNFVREVFVEGVLNKETIIMQTVRETGSEKRVRSLDGMGSFESSVVQFEKGLEAQDAPFEGHRASLGAPVVIKEETDADTGSMKSLEIKCKSQWNGIPGMAVVDVRGDRPGISRWGWRRKFGLRFVFRRRAGEPRHDGSEITQY